MNGRLVDEALERTIVFDGAMGTMLMAAGLAAGEIPERWNLDRPSRVMEIHRRYFEAGADVVHTNSFGANPLKLSDKGLEADTVRLNIEAARIARQVCPEGGFVAGDMGPTGKMPAPFGDTTSGDMEEAFYTQAAALLEGGVDVISIETMFCLDEALAAVRAAVRAGAETVIGGITYSRTKNGFFTIMGERLETCVAGLEEAGARVIASNCTLGSNDMIDLTARMRACTAKPILIQPNAGKPVTRQGITTYAQDPAEFAAHALAIRDAGARMIGGCCGTNVEFIRQTALALR